MKIVRIQINEFGPLCERTFEFDDALTIIRGDNESGKSTLLLFIKFALYGLSKRARPNSVPETERAISHATGNASGSMVVSHLGKLYRIDRQIRKGVRNTSERVQLTDLETGLKCDYGNSPGEFLLGIPEEVFENSCGISQLGCSTVKGEQISNAIRNLLSSADESIDYQKAIKALDNARVKYLHKDKKGGSIYTLTTHEEELNSRYIKAVEDSCETERIEAELVKLEDKISEVSSKQQIADELSSKITLRSVIKLFDKLHEYESEQKLNRARLLELNELLRRGDISLDRAFIAELAGVETELKLTYNEYLKSKGEVDGFLTDKNEENVTLLEKVERAGGIEAVTSFFKKKLGSLKTKTVFAALFALLAVISASVNFLSIAPSGLSSLLLPVAIAMLALSAVFIFMKAHTMGQLKKKCAELGITKPEIQKFLRSVEQALLLEDERKELLEQKTAQLSIKERVLSSTLSKCADIFRKHGIDIIDDSAEGMMKQSAELVESTTALCNERDIFIAKISSLDARISELSAELSDYNEHQTRRRVSNEVLAMSEDEIREAKKEKSYYDLQLKALGEKKLAAERALLERKYSTQDPFDIAAKLSETSELLELQTNRFNAIVLAMEALDTASTNLRNTIAPKIRASANGYIQNITDGKYDSVAVSDTLDLEMSENGFSYPIDSFSTGTKDAAYLALRLSLLSLIPSEEAPPILMDETLAMMDDKRATKLLSMLRDHASDKGQCILFCCHDREERLCRDADIAFSSIVM